MVTEESMFKALRARKGSFKAVPWQWGMWKVRYTGQHNFKNYMVMLSQGEAESIAAEMNAKSMA